MRWGGRLDYLTAAYEGVGAKTPALKLLVILLSRFSEKCFRIFALITSSFPLKH